MYPNSAHASASADNTSFDRHFSNEDDIYTKNSIHSRACLRSPRGYCPGSRTLPRRVASRRCAHRGRHRAHDSRRENSHDTRPVEIQHPGMPSARYSRDMDERRPPRCKGGIYMGRLDVGRLDQRLVHGYAGTYMPRRYIQPRPRRTLRRGGGQRSPLQEERHHTRPGRKHIPHAS